MQLHDERLMSVMAPLFMADDAEFQRFEVDLQRAFDIGVEAVSVDVWWAVVHADRSRAKWDYYDRVFAAIQSKGLSIVPIMSYHRCGGGPGDNVNIGLPPRDPGNPTSVNEPRFA